MKTKDLSLLKNNILFDAMSEAELSQILTCLNPLIKTYQPEEFIYMPNTPYQYLYIILQGEVSLFKEDIKDGRHLLEILKANAIIGEITTFSKNKSCSCAAVATKPSTIMLLPSKNFASFCHKACPAHQKLVTNTFYLLSDKAHFYKNKINLLTTSSIRLKLIKYFLGLYETQSSNKLLLPFSRKDFAEFLNVTRPSLSRELAHMRDEGLITFDKNEITLCDIKMLNKILSEI